MSTVDYSTQTIEQRMARGDRARALLEDPTLGEAFNVLRQGYQDKWVGSRDPAEREDLWQRVQVIDDVHRALRAFVNAGQVARHERELEQESEDVTEH